MLSIFYEYLYDIYHLSITTYYYTYTKITLSKYLFSRKAIDNDK